MLSAHISNEFKHLYQEILDKPRKPFDFFSIFGNSPCEWFLSGRADADRWSKISYIRELIENGDYAVNTITKGSLNHFAMTFPEEPVLKKWIMVKEESSNAR